MNRSTNSLLLTSILVATSIAMLHRTSISAAEPPVNLLIIQTDEHNFRTLGCYRDTLPKEQAFVWGPKAIVETPAIDSIAKRGAICTSFYATSPVCTPSRASFFTGHYPQDTNSWQNDRPMRSDIKTFAAMLTDAGYKTGYAGKWHLDGPGKPQWAPERQFGFADNRFMFNRGHWKKFELTDDGPRVGGRSKSGSPNYDLAGADKKTFSTDWLTDRAIDFVRQHAQQPFCFHLSLPDPHGPNTVRPPYDTMYQDLPIHPPMTFDRAAENPKWADASGRNAIKTFQTQQMALYFGMVRCIDDNVARLLATLDELDLTDHTMVVFTSDHGDLCYEHGRLNKGNPYEGSAKIPMIIAAPKIIPAGTVVDEALGTVDFLPTVMTLMGKPAGQGVQGRDASKLLTGKSVDDWHDITFLRSAGPAAGWIAAVSDRYKLVVSVADTPWLFDLQDDPDELINQLAASPHHPAAKEFAQAILQYAEQFKDPHAENPKIRSQLLELAKH
ncbi:sulfatase family protein [Stieleria varia]|uniref:Choline-sulfatase n=1 Tax=Stieleria varia TaxID=2528005 RepID=A0A5C6B0D2_9BACT|nr:sulfatase [Stieleria varia]TWU04852.1 Choline-sulfatase [Stieleria varia]